LVTKPSDITDAISAGSGKVTFTVVDVRTGRLFDIVGLEAQ
jgi:kynureninase